MGWNVKFLVVATVKHGVLLILPKWADHACANQGDGQGIDARLDKWAHPLTLQDRLQHSDD